MELQFLEEDERGRRQGDAQLIGPEARTAGAPEGEGVFQFLDSDSHCRRGRNTRGCRSTPAFARRFVMTKRGSIARHSSVVPHHFGFDNGAPGHRPGARLIRSPPHRQSLVSWVVATTARSGATAGSACRVRTALFPMVDDILDPGRLQVVKNLRRSEAPIQPHAEPGCGERRARVSGAAASAAPPRQPSPPRCPGGGSRRRGTAVPHRQRSGSPRVASSTSDHRSH